MTAICQGGTSGWRNSHRVLRRGRRSGGESGSGRGTSHLAGSGAHASHLSHLGGRYAGHLAWSGLLILTAFNIYDSRLRPFYWPPYRLPWASTASLVAPQSAFHWNKQPLREVAWTRPLVSSSSRRSWRTFSTFRRCHRGGAPGQSA